MFKDSKKIFTITELHKELTERLKEVANRDEPLFRRLKQVCEFMELYQKVIEDSPFGIVLVDEKNEFIFSNSFAENITGYTIKDIPDINTWLEKVYPDEEYRKRVVEEMKTISKEENPRIREAIITCKNGEKKRCRFVSHLLPSHMRVLYLSEVTDGSRITSVILNKLPDLYFRLNLEGTFLDFLGGNESDLMLPPEKFIGKNIRDLLPDDILKRAEIAIQQMREKGTEVTIEYAMTIKGKDKIYEGRFIPIPGKQFVFVARDITKQKILEEEKRDSFTKYNKKLGSIKVLHGMLPICASCKKIRDKAGKWFHVENYIEDHSEADFTHTICPECIKKLYPDITEEDLI